MKVREIMTSGSLATATLDTTIEEIANMMKAEDVGAVPVLDDDQKLAGIITDRDIVVRAIAEGEDPTECTAEDILSEQLHTIAPEADLAEAIELMSLHQIRRLPVVEENQVIGIVSLGDLSVKSQPEQAGEALEDISMPIHAQKPAREQEPEGGRVSRQRQSSGEQVAEEEAGYQRGQQDTSVRRGTAQMGSSRAESKLAGRVRNQSQSRQSIENELVNVEGEEEPRFQNAGGGQARMRANQQNLTARERQEPSTRRRNASAVRGGKAGRSSRASTQGVPNRGSRQENQRQKKVASMRAAGKAGRGQSKRRAS